LALAALAAVFIWLPKVDWHMVRNKLQRPGERTVGPAEELSGVRAADTSVVFADSASLNELLRLMAEDELEVRLQQWSDSVEVVAGRLQAYRELLFAVRESVRLEESSGPATLSGHYFRAVGRLRGLEGQIGELGASIDSLSGLLAAVEAAGRRKIRPAAERPGRAAPETLRWLTPAAVPIKQACLSCHPPLEGGRVVLVPGEEPGAYPQAMLQHPPKEFGCVSCHHGEAESTDFEKAHGADSLGRPFLPGRLSLRSCGLCHSAAVLSWNGSALFPWPKDCLACHENGPLKEIEADSSRAALVDSLAGEQKLRAWLLRHWSEKSARLPGREQFERVLSLVSAATLQSESPADSTVLPQGDNTYHCPFCKRRFSVLASIRDPVCPVDGTALLPEQR